MLYETQIIPTNIVLSRSSYAQTVRAVIQRAFEKVRQSKQIKYTEIYDKWQQKLQNEILWHFDTKFP